jgi:hypothetical protein
MANKFVTFLDHLGGVALKIFTVGTKVAQTVEPELDIALSASGLTGVATLFNSVVGLAAAAQATANGVAGTGPQKLALVTAGVTPLFEQFLQGQGIVMNTTQINSWVSLAVNLVMAIPAPSTTPITPATTAVVITPTGPTATSNIAPVTGAAVIK